MNKKVTVIVPIYNVEKYIHRCIRSILNQTYSNLEIILVDDGSPDNCGMICDDYSKLDTRIVVIHKKNGGLSSARNKGLDIASGDYIAFVDGDDYISETMIEDLISSAIQNSADIVHCNFEVVDEYDRIVKYKNRDLDDGKILNAYETLCENIIFHKVKVMAWNKLYKSELFKDLRFDEGYVYEDELLFPRIIFRSKSNVMLNKKLYFYVQSPKSITNTDINSNKIKSKKYLVEVLEKFYIEKYPDLMKHIYMAICFVCLGTINEIRKSKNVDNKSSEEIYFKDKYLYSYSRMKNYDKKCDIPVKKTVLCFIMSIIFKLSHNKS